MANGRRARTKRTSASTAGMNGGHTIMQRWALLQSDGCPALDGGFHAGPLFIIRKQRLPVRQKGKEGILHRAQTKRRTPTWADMAAIAAIYAEAKRITELTGELYVVDHIVPKCGRIVSGLHVPWNLRVIHWRENAIKGAAWWPDMPFEQIPLL